MGDIAERIRSLPADKVDSLLKQLRPGLQMKTASAAPAPAARPSKRIFREAQDQNFYLDVEQPGTLESLVFRTRPRHALQADELEVEIQAACLNFRDIAITLGIYPMPPGVPMPKPGCDGAGRVVAVGSAIKRFKVGDEVFFLGTDSTFSRFARAREESTFLKPPDWSFEEAAALALVCITVGYSLRVPGRLQAGERILIHSAAGGIGLMAIQMAREIGAEVYTTAGTPEKHAYLRSIGVNRILDSRSLSWVEGIRDMTHGQGVDVILNSLPAEHIDKGLTVLRTGGRFLELGKRDFAPGRMLDLAPFSRTLDFAAIDATHVFKTPNVINPVIDTIRDWLRKGVVKPLPTKVFPVSKVIDAFRHMTTGLHIGRIAITMHGEPILVAAAKK